jgi:hypothetical protein
MQGYGRRSEDAMQRDGECTNMHKTEILYYFLQFLLKENTDELAALL